MTETKLALRSVRRKPKLDSLPQEVYDLIFKYASSPGMRLKHHLWPMLLVSRQMYHAVLPSLYRRIFFGVDSSIGSYQANYKLLQLADKENQGLLHIEEVKLFPQDELKREPSVAADYPDAMQLLAAIPRDQLRRFNWDSWHQMPREILRLLWKRQHRLTNIELLRCNKPLDEVIDDFGVGDNSFYGHATELRIADMDWGTVLTSALHVLKERPQIHTLELDFWSIRSNVDVVDDGLGNHVNADSIELARAYYENLLKELFRPSKQLERASPLAITTLYLHCVDLWHGPRYLFAGLELRVLEKLHIISCPRVQNLLLKMSQLPTEKRSQLRHFHIYHEQDPAELTWVSDDNQTDRTIYSVNEFLLSIKDTLQDLWIVMRGLHRRDRLLNPMARGIANHGSSLLKLTADVRTCEPSHSATTGEQYVGWFPLDTWEEVCASMGQLEQLYVPFPLVVANEYMTARQEYHFYLDTALQIPTLKTLNMTTWPYPLHTKLFPPGDDRPSDPIPYIVGPWKTGRSSRTWFPIGFYHHCLKYIVDNIASRRSQLIFNPCKHLDIVGFGLLERNHYMSDLQNPLEPVYFVNPGWKRSDGEFPNMERRTYKEVSRTRRSALLSGAIDIDWLAKKMISTRRLTRG
ncbi:MAG: hypothetical protein Q9213_006672 [Squamulea squamosa]